ncbi:MAG: hypothetical protein L0Z53_06210 [Acidobacteriales bacterium]|nr:hypothetical protein [Terriglobales bacterium]
MNVRWGPFVDRWVVERSGIISDTERTFLSNRRRRAKTALDTDPANADKQAWFAAISEELESANAGRRVILYTKVLNRTVFDTLARHDIQRYGGVMRFIDELEASERRAETEAHRASFEAGVAFNKELYDQIEFIGRRRSTDLGHGVRWEDMLARGSSGDPNTWCVIDKRHSSRAGGAAGADGAASAVETE